MMASSKWLVKSSAIVTASTTVGTPTAMTGMPMVSCEIFNRLLPTPEPE